MKFLNSKTFKSRIYRYSLKFYPLKSNIYVSENVNETSWRLWPSIALYIYVRTFLLFQVDPVNMLIKFSF